MWGALPDRLRRRASRLWTRSNWRLLLEMVRAGFKASEHNSILGVIWSLVGPIATLLVLYAIFTSHFGTQIVAYPLYLLLGIVLVGYFVTATRYLITLFFNHRYLLLNTTVPRETLILANLAPHVYKLLVELLLCVGLSIFFGLFSWRLLVLSIPLLIGYVGLSIGVGLVLALVYSFARDVEHIWVIATRLLFFATPVFYGLDSISPPARAAIYWLNPLTPFLLAFRETFMSSEPLQWSLFGHSLLLGLASLAVGYLAFSLMESAALERA